MPSTDANSNDSGKSINKALEEFMRNLKDLLPGETFDGEFELDGYELNPKDEKNENAQPDYKLNFLIPDNCVNPKNAQRAIDMGRFVDANKHRYTKNAIKALWNVAFRTHTIINLGKLEILLRVPSLLTSDQSFIDRNFAYLEKHSYAPLVINEDTLQLALIVREFLQAIIAINDPFSMLPNKPKIIADKKQSLKTQIKDIIQVLDKRVAGYTAMVDPKVIQINKEINNAVYKLEKELTDIYRPLFMLKSRFNTIKSLPQGIIQVESVSERLTFIETNLEQIQQLRHDLSTVDQQISELEKKKIQTLEEFKTRFPEASYEYVPKSQYTPENGEAKEEDALNNPEKMEELFRKLIPSAICNSKYDEQISKINKLQLDNAAKITEQLEKDLISYKTLTELQLQFEELPDKGSKEESLEDDLLSVLQEKKYSDLSSIETDLQKLDELETELKKQLELDQKHQSTLQAQQNSCKELMEKSVFLISSETFISECDALNLKLIDKLFEMNKRIEQTQNSLTAVGGKRRELEYQQKKQAAKDNLTELNKLLDSVEKKLEQKIGQESHLKKLLSENNQPTEEFQINKKLADIDAQILQRLNLRKKLRRLEEIHKAPAIHQIDFDDLATAMDWDKDDREAWEKTFEEVRSSQTAQTSGGIFNFFTGLYTSFRLSDFNYSIQATIESRIKELEKQLQTGQSIKDLRKQKTMLLKQLEYQANLQTNREEQTNLKAEIQNLKQELNGLQLRTLETEIEELIPVIKERKDSISQLEAQLNSADSKNPYKIRQEFQSKVNNILEEKFAEKIKKIEENLKKVVKADEIDSRMKELRCEYHELNKKIQEMTTKVENKKENELKDSIKTALQDRRDKIYNHFTNDIEKYIVKRQKEYAVKDFFSNVVAVFLRKFDYKTDTTKQIEYLNRLKILLAIFKVTDDKADKTSLLNIISTGKKDPALKPLLSNLEKSLDEYVWYKASLERQNKRKEIDLDTYDYKAANSSIYLPR